ncbi:MAG: hypothetical protein ACRYFX_14000 [Janthinobacterium lividum]
MSEKLKLSGLLPRGEAKAIAARLGLTPGSVSAALHRAHPGHPAVREALRVVRELGIVEAAQTLATLKIAA